MFQSFRHVEVTQHILDVWENLLSLKLIRAGTGTGFTGNQDSLYSRQPSHFSRCRIHKMLMYEQDGLLDSITRMAHHVDLCEQSRHYYAGLALMDLSFATANQDEKDENIYKNSIVPRVEMNRTSFAEQR
jgi:hypothetical protein